MTNFKNKPEILAPAGSVAALRGALTAGADAVYIGGTRFSARAYADNAEGADLLDAIDFAHLNGKKVYMTINTLFKEKELVKELYSFLVPYYERGLDAAIVQDFGLLKTLKALFPDLPVHASTQMTVASPLGAKLLEEYGNVTRIVPARELSLTEIKRLRSETKLEIECFVHGALCYSYSGQCLFSSMIGGRSGNRGRCAQPCRQPYDLFDGEKKLGKGYLLSLKDMNSLNSLPDLIDAGIDSFKIEGRMKRPEYSAGIAGLYSYLTNKYMELGREGYADFISANPDKIDEIMTNAADLYNRGGFSTGYYFNYHGKDMMSMVRPNHSGLQIGAVTGVAKRMVSIKVTKAVHPQDVVEIRGAEPFEFTLGKEGVKKMEESGKHIYEVVVGPEAKVRIGDPVFRTKNDFLLTSIQGEYLAKSAKGRVTGFLTAFTGCPLSLTVNFGDISFTAEGDIVQAALKAPMTEADFIKTLSKTGGALFDFSEIDVSCGENVFVAVGSLKNLRNEAFKGLAEQIKESCSRHAGYSEDEAQEFFERQKENYENRPVSKPSCTVSVMTPEQLEVVLQEDIADSLILDLRLLPLKEQIEEVRKAEAAGKTAYLSMPHIFRNKEREVFLREFDFEHPVKLYIHSLDALEFARENGLMQGIKASYALYATNTCAAAFLKEEGVNELSYSVEETACEIEETGIRDGELFVYGRTPLMYTAQCLIDNVSVCLKKSMAERGHYFIKDKTSAEFPVVPLCRECMDIIYNSRTTSLIGLEELDEISAASHLLAFTIESPDQVRKVLRAYRENNGTGLTNITRGHIRNSVE